MFGLGIVGTILLIIIILWLVAGLAGIGVALLGVDALLDMLPPLAIDADAVARTLAALAIGAALVGLAHLVVARGLRRDGSWAVSGGILLAAGAAIAFGALAAAAVTSGVAGTLTVIGAVAAACGAMLAAVAYGAAAALLVHRLRSRAPI